MALPIASEIKTMKFTFRGRPFVRGTKTVELRGMGVNFRGMPFVGVDVEASSHVITAQAANVQISGAIDCLAFIGTGVASLTISGQCVSAGVIAGVTVIEAEPGIVSIDGISAIFGWIGIIAEPGDLTISGCVSAIVMVIILIPDSGTVDISGSAVSIGSISVLAGSELKYECILSGGGVAETVSVPMSAFNSRQRAGDPSYSEVTIPGLDYLADILARPTGSFSVSILIEKSGVVLQREILFASGIDSVSISGNDTQQAIILSGYYTAEAPATPAQLTVSGVNYRSLNAGVITLRKPEPDLYLRPGDIVIYDGDSFVVRLITYTMSVVFGMSMEITI